MKTAPKTGLQTRSRGPKDGSKSGSKDASPKRGTEGKPKGAPPPIVPPPDRTAVRRYLTVDEWRRLLAAVVGDVRANALIRLIYEAGLRASEPGLIRLAWLRDLHQTRRIYIHRGKGSEAGYVRLTRTAAEAVLAYARETHPQPTEEAFLFPGRRYRGEVAQGLSRWRVRAIYLDAARRARLGPALRHPHVLKATRVQHLFDAARAKKIDDKDLVFALAELVGHKRALTTVQYYLAESAESRRMIEEVSEELAVIKGDA